MELSWIYSIPAVVLTLALIFCWRKNRSLAHPGVVLIGLYWLSNFGALFLNTDTLTSFNFNHTWQILSGYTALLLLALMPAPFLVRLPSPNFSQNVVIRLLFFALIPLAWYSFLYQIPFAYISFQTGADIIRLRINTEEFSPLPPNFLTTVATATSQFYPLYALAVVEGLIRGRGKPYIVSCVIGALCVVVNAICFAARDGMLWFLMSFWFAYWLYRPDLAGKFGRWIRLGMTAAAAGAVLVLSVYTYQRFSSSSTGIFDAVMTYATQQPFVFAETVAEQDEFYGLNLRLPVVADLLGTFEPIRREREFEWTFGTFAKDLYAMAGWSTAFMAAAGIGVFFTVIFRSARRLNPIAACLLMLLYFQFMTQGMFYLRLGTKAGNTYILLILALSVILQVLFGSEAKPVEQPERPDRHADPSPTPAEAT